MSILYSQISYIIIYMNGLGERIKSLRLENNYTQPQLAEKLNVSNAVISFWENNVNEPKATYIRMIAECFSVSTDYLLGLEDESGARTATQINNLSHFNNSGTIKF